MILNTNNQCNFNSFKHNARNLAQFITISIIYIKLSISRLITLINQEAILYYFAARQK